MNIKLIMFSGIVTALIGAVLGLGAAKIGQKDFNQLRYQTHFYEDLNQNYYAAIGAGLGFAVGIGQECIRELKEQRDREFGEQD